MKLITLHIIHRRIVLVLAAMMLALSALAGKVSITARIDSTAIIMGNQLYLRYQIVQDAGTIGHLVIENPDRLTPDIDIIDDTQADTTDLGNNRIQIDRALLIQAFDSGIYQIPAARYVVGADTFRSNPLNLKVIPVPVDTLADIHGYADIDYDAVPFVLSDWIPDFIYDYWWAWLIAIAIVAIAGWLYHRYRKGLPLRPKKVIVVPPYDEAVAALEKLKADKLWQNGREKEYYTSITDILRRYIDRRFGINAVEMTSEQIIATLRENNETRAVNSQLQMILEVADLVKFANERPLPDDNEAAWQRARDFVEATKPLAEEDADKDADDKPADNVEPRDKESTDDSVK